MKNFLVCIVLPFLVISCSTDSDFNTSEEINSIGMEESPSSKIPENQANPFDAKGKKYRELLDRYWTDNGVPNSAQEISKQIHFVSMNLKSGGFSNKLNATISAEEITGIMDDPLQHLTEIVGTSSLSEEAKLVLIHFIKSLIEYKEYDYEAMYDHIVSYETFVMNSPALTEKEKEFLLSVTALSRYSTDEESKHKDRDWEISVGNKEKQSVNDKYAVSIVSIIAMLR
jgi:hypothetical protein